jgi:chromosome segregation ATPase
MCDERCASMDATVKKLEADLARDFAASKAVETRLDERNLELKAERRKSESLQAALDAVQKVEPTGDDEADKLRESLPRAAALERELETVKKDAEEIAAHAAEQTRRREAAEAAAQELKVQRDALRRDMDKAKELCGAKETALAAQIALVKTLQEELTVARSARDASQKALSEAEARASQARAEVTRVRADDAADRRAREAEARLELLERDRRDERKALEDAKARSDARLRALEERAESSKRAENDARATIDDLRRQLDDRSGAQDNVLRDRASKAEADAQRAKRSTDEATRSKNEIQQQCHDAEERLAASEEAVRKLRGEARDMARKLSDAEDRAAELDKEQAWTREKLDKLSQQRDGEAAKRLSVERDLASLRASVDGGTSDAVLVESLRLRAEKAEAERDAATKRALHLETELARARTQAPATPDDRATRSAKRERDAAVDALRHAEAALRQATGAPQESPRSRVDDEKGALREAQDLVKKQRAWLKERQRQLEERRTAWRSRAALRGNGSTRERQHLDREASDLNKLVRQLRRAQSWLEDRNEKVRRVETGASPLTELDLLDDDTLCSSVSETPHRRRRRYRRAPEVSYGMYDPYRPPAVYYCVPPPSRPTDDYYHQAQAQAPSHTNWAPPPPPPVVPQPTLATPLRDWAVNREHAQGRMHSHVKWLDGLRNELTAHCYGKPEPEVVGVPNDSALDAAVEARLRG